MFWIAGNSDYDIEVNNCEHIANYIMTGKPISHQAMEMQCRAKCCNTCIQSLKSITVIISILICLVSAGLGTLARRAYEKLLVALIIAEKAGIKNDSFECENFFGKKYYKIGNHFITVRSKGICFQEIHKC